MSMKVATDTPKAELASRMDRQTERRTWPVALGTLEVVEFWGRLLR